MSAAAGETHLPRGPRLSLRPGARLASLARGDAADPAWVRPALIGLLGATALLYLVDLSVSGWANAFYSAAVQAASKSWEAFFFGSFDSSNFITVDKPPAALWAMDASVRLFGVSSWSILVPQALEGVAAVGLLYATVRRRFSPGAGLLAGAALALTPVAALMFRFNNPDALLTLLLVASAYALTRALERGATRWILLAGAIVGFAFLAKSLQAFLVVPGFAAVYLLAAPVSLRRRLVQLLGSGVALVLAGGWWLAVVSLWPASSRPYIGGSQDNSELNLIFGYNGFGRLDGNEAGSVVGGGAGRAGGSQWGPTGIGRLFGGEMGTQISWLLPAALIFAVALLWVTRRRPRTDGRRATVLIWSSWLVVSGLVFSFAQGIIHPYYTVVLAPAIAALVGIGLAATWRERDAWLARLVLALVLASTAFWSYRLLTRTPEWLPWLRIAVLASGLAAAVLVLAGGGVWRRLRLPSPLVAAVSLAALLAAPTAYSMTTVSSAHTGSLPTAGPSGAVTQGGPGGGFGGRGFRFGGGPGGFGNGGRFAPGAAGFPGGANGGAGGFAPGAGAGFRPGGFGGAGGTGAIGGLLQAGTPSAAVVSALRSGAAKFRWVAAVVGANSAAGFQLAADEPVMAIGGFNGTDPAPSLSEFETDVRAGEVHYFISSGGGGGLAPGSSSASRAIAAWVEEHYTAHTLGGVTLYDLATPAL